MTNWREYLDKLYTRPMPIFRSAPDLICAECGCACSTIEVEDDNYGPSEAFGVVEFCHDMAVVSECCGAGVVNGVE